MKQNPIYFNQCISIQDKISDKTLKNIKKISHDMINKTSSLESFSNRLAGNIESEYSFIEHKDILEKIIINLANRYSQETGYAKGLKNLNWKIDDIWVNFQKKYEFNPVHNHSGQLSFILWVQIPYNLDDELKLKNCKNSNNPSNSLFEFLTTDFLGRINHTRIPIDKNWEGTIVIFPSSLNHTVYPFYTSEEYRISISGNLSSFECDIFEKKEDNFSLKYQ